MTGEMSLAPAPLFRCPIHDGAADPTIIWNHNERAWWILYTQRRANLDLPGVAYGHGTDIGIAESPHGRHWCYRGVCEGLKFERGHNSFWAPEVLWHAGLYHMYVSYVRGVSSTWYGAGGAIERQIVHFTSGDLWVWRFESILPLPTARAIDACVHRLPNGRWRMWYKDEADDAHTHAADSEDLFSWRHVGPVITDCQHEGPNVFQWRGAYWLIADAWRGLAVYRSDDAEHWTRQASILDRPGTRPEDGIIGQHADVLVQGEHAYIFYFTHPGRKLNAAGEGVLGAERVFGVEPYETRRTVLQVARLDLEGTRLICDRDAPFDFTLVPPVAPES
jgi:hypothetical protein